MFLLQLIKGNLELWQWILLGIVLLPETIRDLKTRKVNGYVCIVMILVAMEMRIHLDKDTSLSIMIDLIPGVLVYILSIFYESIGTGDAWMLMFIGSVVGLNTELAIIGIALFGASVISLTLLLLKKVNKKTEIPFVPFMSLGVIAGGLL